MLAGSNGLGAYEYLGGPSTFCTKVEDLIEDVEAKGLALAEDLELLPNVNTTGEVLETMSLCEHPNLSGPRWKA